MFFLVAIAAGHLARVFSGLICILVSNAVVEGINGVNSRGWVEALSSLFLISVMAVFFILFSDFGMGFFQLLSV